MIGPLGISREAILAALAVESGEMKPGEDRLIVLVDSAGRETDVPLRQFRLRLLNGLRLDGLDFSIVPGGPRVAS